MSNHSLIKKSMLALALTLPGIAMQSPHFRRKSKKINASER